MPVFAWFRGLGDGLLDMADGGLILLKVVVRHRGQEIDIGRGVLLVAEPLRQHREALAVLLGLDIDLGQVIAQRVGHLPR